jgi:hypothetical protein
MKDFFEKLLAFTQSIRAGKSKMISEEYNYTWVSEWKGDGIQAGSAYEEVSAG